MPFVNIRELARDTSRVVSAVASSGRPAVITRGGKPVAALMPMAEEDLEDWILANHPDLVRSYEQAERDFAAGRGVPLERVLAELAALDAKAGGKRRSAPNKGRAKNPTKKAR